MSKHTSIRRKTSAKTTKSTRAQKRKPTKKNSARKRHLATPKSHVQRQFEFSTEGRFFDLSHIFNKVNARYFRNRLRSYKITWGRRRKEKPRTYIVFGSIQEQDRLIRIHPLLDRPFVPQWYVEYVVYHEMLHAFVPDKYDSAGRRIVHHEGFLQREKKFRHYRRSVSWEQENLGRFLR